MINLGAAIKETIRRLAKREIRTETAKTKQAVAQYRRDIAKLKRQIGAQQKEIVFLKTQEHKRLAPSGLAEPEPQEGTRFSARSVRAQRARLKLSAADFAKLVGVSALTVYHWEHGKSRPRKQQFAALVAVRGIGRRECLARLALLEAKEQRAAGKNRRKPRQK